MSAASLAQLPLFVALMGVFLLVPAIVHQQPVVALAASDMFFPAVVASSSLAGLLLLVILSRYECVPKMDCAAEVVLDFKRLEQCVARGRALVPLIARVVQDECVVL